MFCGKCGSTVPDGNEFCSNCGTKLFNTSGSNQTIAQPAQTVAVNMVTQPQEIHHSNGMGIAGLVLGIVGMFFFWIPYFGAFLSILGLLFSIIGLAKKNVSKGTAIVGLILSIIAAFLGLVMILGIGTYLDKAREASSSAAYQSSYNSSVNEEIDRALS